jgi:catechol 2,3-dioxygenase-like lactoylglutathione lyase family enzyme
MRTPVRHHHTALHVADLQRSSTFYVEGLGLTPIDQWRSGEYIGELFGRPGVDVRALLLATHDRAFRLELVKVDPAAPPVDPSAAAPGTAHVAFAVSDVTALFARMKRLGFSSVSDPVVPTSGPNAGGMLVYLLDPDGNRVELIQEVEQSRDSVPATPESR